MPRKPHHEVLIFSRSVWLNTGWDKDADTQQWRVYARPRHCGRGGLRPWWSGLTPKSDIGPIPNVNLPTPCLRAYVYTEWSWDVPPRPNGTDLWVETADPNMWAVRYTQHNWDSCLMAEDEEWHFLYRVEWLTLWGRA